MSDLNVLKNIYKSLLFILILNFSVLSVAEDECSDRVDVPGLPTTPGNYSKQEKWCDGLRFDPNNETVIEPGESITIKAIDGWPPYTIKVSGVGYSLEAIDEETFRLSSKSGSCGSDFVAFATVTVTDLCKNSVTTEIRNTGGTWGQPIQAWFPRCQCSGGECQSCWSWSYCQERRNGCHSHYNDIIEDIVGNQRWVTTHWHCNCAAGCGASSTTIRWCGALDGSRFEIPGTYGLVKNEYVPPSCPTPFDCNIGKQDCAQPWYPSIRTWCIPDMVAYYEWSCQ